MSPALLKTLRARGAPVASPETQRRLLLEAPFEREFRQALGAKLWPLTATGVETLQISVGRLCNLTCRHCHVDAGPDASEVMSLDVARLCVEALERSRVSTVDLTGGAPELNPNFRWLVERCRSLGRRVIDRCNLTVLELASHRGLAEFLAEHGVELVCSLPHYREPLTSRQRGTGVFETSIRALRRLNALGYGDGTSGLRLVLVTNPGGAFLPGNQPSLEAEWKRELVRLHGISFDALFCMTNMPISRFLEWLIESKNLDGYVRRLVESFNPMAARQVMCKSMISVSWDGRLFDCDFNQMLDVGLEPGNPRHIGEFDADRLSRRRIATGRHCFGCTAGAGSSCGGSTTGD